MDGETTAALRRSSILANLRDEDLDHLAAIARERSFSEGEVLTETDSDDARGMWIITEGTVDVSRDGRHLATLGPGEHVGEMALMSDVPRTADVVATSPVQAVQLARWDLRGLIADNPDIALRIMDALAQRLAEQNALD